MTGKDKKHPLLLFWSKRCNIRIFEKRLMEISMHGEGFIKMAEPEGKRAAKHRTRRTGLRLFLSLSNADSRDAGADEQRVLFDLKGNLLVWRIGVP